MSPFARPPHAGRAGVRAHYEEAARLVRETPLTVYVPAPDRLGGVLIPAGSGIVARPLRGAGGAALGPELADRLEVDYFAPGPASDVVTWADRVYHAAGRHVTRYPTHTRSWLPAAQLVPVGRWVPRDGEIVLGDAVLEDLAPGVTPLPADAAARAVAAWLGLGPDAPLSDAECRCTAGHYVEERTLRAMEASGDPAQQLQARVFRQHVQRRR